MSNRRFEMYEYRQIILRLRSGEGLRPIARATLVDRKTIRKIRDIAQHEGWLHSQDIPDNETLEKILGTPKKSLPKSNVLFPHKSRVEEWYKQGIQASTIYLTLQREHGFTGGYNAVQRFVKTLKDKSIEVTIILEFKPGECAQVDFGAGPKLINELTGEIIKTWIFVMVLGWSRHMYAEIVLKQMSKHG
jgi:hypothetical protein